MNKYLNNEYPYYYDLKNGLLIGVIILLLSTFFSVLFEPFEVNYKELRFSFFIISLIHSLVSFVVFIIGILVLKFFRKEEDWKVKNEFLFLIMVLIIIGVFQFLIRDFIYDKEDNWSFRYLYEEVRNTVLVGSLLIFVITSINLERLKTIYTNRGKELKVLVEPNVNSLTEVAIKTQVKSDDFILDLKEFVYAKSDKNYVEIILNNQKLLKRMTIKSLETQLLEYNFIFKTHRSYILNLNKIERIKGNAQGYQLFLKNKQDTIPVSRTMISKFEDRVNQLSL